ncbi:MAG: hypothetical protein PHU81_09760 [Acidobacteriota bacterium]|nr:hypothetical protein [Acidobacteriota bacterium]
MGGRILLILTWGGYFDSEISEANFFVCPRASGYNPIYGMDGIDCFAQVCLHEKTHLEDWRGFWPHGYNSALDQDGDGRPDWIDYTEPRAEAAMQTWIKGSADHEDWSNPGHQAQ